MWCKSELLCLSIILVNTAVALSCIIFELYNVWLLSCCGRRQKQRAVVGWTTSGCFSKWFLLISINTDTDLVGNVFTPVILLPGPPLPSCNHKQTHCHLHGWQRRLHFRQWVAYVHNKIWDWYCITASMELMKHKDYQKRGNSLHNQ